VNVDAVVDSKPVAAEPEDLEDLANDQHLIYNG
jgi:hypothetical protein